MVDIRQVYDPTYAAWPDLKFGRVVLAPVRVGVDRTTGRMLVGWPHVVQSMSVIFMTRFHERVLRRWVGSFVPHLLGENAVERVVTRFYWAIASAIDLWEPCYRIIRVHVQANPAENLTTADALRLGHLVTRNEGVYMPRGHLGDFTPENRRAIGLLGLGHGLWRHDING